MSASPATERASPRYRGLDTWPAADVLAALFEAQAAAVAAVRPALAQIEAACAAAAPLLWAGGRLAYAGAGSSARIAALDASELPPTFGFPAGRLLLLIAGGPAALQASIEDAEDDAQAAQQAVDRLGIGQGDVLFGIAASGSTPYTVAAVMAARERGALTAGLASVAGSPLVQAAAYPILTETGAEPLAGSTRLKAGTAQKVALNLFSTQLMLLLGHVHDGLMVDMQPRNAKLRRRAVAMTQQIGGGDAIEATEALEASGWRIKQAVLIRRFGIDATAAAALLGGHQGVLRAALADANVPQRAAVPGVLPAHSSGDGNAS